MAKRGWMLTLLMFFFFLFIAFFFCFIADRTQKVLYVYLAILVLSLIAGLRTVDVGTDTLTYTLQFDEIVRNNGGSYFDTEPLFILITRIIGSIFSGKANIYYFVLSLITNSLILLRLWAYRKASSFTFMSIMFISLFYPQTMNIMRQYLALAIIFYFSKLLEERKYLFFTLINICCFFIHNSSIICLLLLAIYYYYLERPNLFKIVIIAFSIIGLLAYLVNVIIIYLQQYEYLLELEDNDANLTLILDIFCFSLLFLKLRTKHVNYKINMTIVLTGLVLLFIGTAYDQLGRIAYYFSIFMIPLYSAKNYKYDLKYSLRAIYFSLCLYTLFIKVMIKGVSGIYPYHIISL